MNTKSTQNTQSVYEKILIAARAKFGGSYQHSKLKRVSSIAFYENNQWWFRIVNADLRTEITYSVVDER